MRFLFYQYFSSEGGTSRTSSGGSRAGNMNNQNDDSVANISSEKPVQHKWPIRPGVHVHVNGLHTLNNSVNTGNTGGAGPTNVPAEKITGFSYGARNSNSGSGSSAGSSTANCDDISNAGSSSTGNDDMITNNSTLNTKHKEVIARGTSTERNMPNPSETLATSTTQYSESNQSSNNITNQNKTATNAKPMQGRLCYFLFFCIFPLVVVCY